MSHFLYLLQGFDCYPSQPTTCSHTTEKPPKNNTLSGWSWTNQYVTKNNVWQEHFLETKDPQNVKNQSRELNKTEQQQQQQQQEEEEEEEEEEQ